MSVRDIVLFPHDILSRPCHAVQVFGPALERLIEDLVDTMSRSPGVGLAAPQIGVSERVSVIDVSRRPPKSKALPPKSHGLIVLINPILVSGEGVQVPREGCLSVPDLLGNVRRFDNVTVRFQSPDGSERTISSSGFEALALQHEIDHLDGKLFLDRIANLKTDIFRRKAP